MKNWIKYIFLALYSLSLVSCTYDTLESEQFFDKVVVRLTLNVPGSDSRVGGDYQYGGTDPNIEEQRYIEDAYILLFEHTTDKSGKLIGFAKATLGGDQGAVTRDIEGQFAKNNGSIDIVVLANLNHNGFNPTFDEWKEKTEKEIYKSMVYSYPAKWNLAERYLPMWGKKSEVSLNASEITISSFNLYRGVAKMGLQVAATCTNFTMKEIYVYYVNSKGYCAAPNQTPSDDVYTQYTFPDVPALSTQLTTPIKYTLTDAQEKSFLEQIYLSESNNKNPGSGKQLKVVVGGVYTGPGLVDNNATSYYRIDMEDDKNQDKVLAPFDIIRNHSYIFNIIAVNNPGTPTPDEALDEAVVGLTVEVEDWTEVPMQGITAQYTLTVDNSTFGFEGLTVTPGILNVTTDGTTWDYEKSQDVDNSWFTLGHINKENNSGQITIIPSPNLTGAIRTGYFYVKAGKIGKKITVVQEPGETANCYIFRTPGDYLLKTDIKGNGNGQAWGDDTGNTKVDISLGTTGLNVDNVAILWETAEGLVTIKTNKPDKNGLITYTVKDKKDQWNTSVFEPGHGGNALIGGFDKDNKLVWSWHIWVVGDFANGIQTEQWVTGYDFMDRYLGAYSNEPGNRSLGLLYQWGRKDPFLNAGSILNATPAAESTIIWPKPVKSDSEVGTIEYSVANPTTYIFAAGYDYDSGVSYTDWYFTRDGLVDNTRWGTMKTIYDPCPVGWKVPPGGENDVWERSSGISQMKYTYDSRNLGMNFLNVFCSGSVWYPMTGQRDYDSQYLNQYGFDSGSYWTVTPYNEYAFAFTINTYDWVTSSSEACRAYGFSVRCQKE